MEPHAPRTDDKTQRSCIATMSIGGDLADKIDAIGAAGFSSIELFDGDLNRSGMSPTECARRCADAGLTIEAYQPFRRAEGVPAEEFNSVRSRFTRELQVARQLGAPSILVVSNTDEDADPSRDLSATQLSALADIAAEHEISIMFEALAWGTHISRVADAWGLLQYANHHNVHLVIDTFHLLARGEDLNILNEIPGHEVGLLQIADAPWLTMDIIQWSRNHRLFPGEGEMDVVTPLSTIMSSGYSGKLSLEIFNPGYRELPVASTARRAAEALSQLTTTLLAARPEQPQCA